MHIPKNISFITVPAIAGDELRAVYALRGAGEQGAGAVFTVVCGAVA